MSLRAIAAIIPLLVVIVIVGGTLIARRDGYRVGGEVVVRCRSWHVFTTIWVPGASLKAIRLGWLRFQWCPVGRHWAVVAPVRDAELTDAERRFAAQHHDARIP